jgi:hypothetical protein
MSVGVSVLTFWLRHCVGTITLARIARVIRAELLLRASHAMQGGSRPPSQWDPRLLAIVAAALIAIAAATVL